MVYTCAFIQYKQNQNLITGNQSAWCGIHRKLSLLSKWLFCFQRVDLVDFYLTSVTPPHFPVLQVFCLLICLFLLCYISLSFAIFLSIFSDEPQTPSRLPNGIVRRRYVVIFTTFIKLCTVLFLCSQWWVLHDDIYM